MLNAEGRKHARDTRQECSTSAWSHS